MKLRKKLLAPFIYIVLSVVMSNAQATRNVQGAGAISCGEWISQRSNGDHHLALSWSFGIYECI